MKTFLLGVLLASFALVSCKGEDKGPTAAAIKSVITTAPPPSSAPAPANPAGGSDTPTNLVAQEVTNVGVKNFDQINATFSILTGVPQTDNDIRTEFDALKASLPQGNDIRTFGGSTQNAVIKLAARYCDRAVRANNLQAVGQAAGVLTRQMVIPSNLLNANNQAITAVNVPGQTPAVVFSTGNKNKVADFLIERFWGRDPMEPATNSDMVLTQLMTDLVAGEINNANATIAVLVGACTAALGNANVFTQ